MQWKYLRPDKATWEMEDSMHEAYSFLFDSENTEDGFIPKGIGM